MLDGQDAALRGARPVTRSSTSTLKGGDHEVKAEESHHHGQGYEGARAAQG